MPRLDSARHEGPGRRRHAPGLGRLALACALAAAGGPAAAIDYTWLGGTGVWTDPARWSPTGTPGAGDDARLASGRADLLVNATIAGWFQSGGTLGGNGWLTVTREMGWTGGTVLPDGGTVEVRGDLVISGNTGKTLGRQGDAAASRLLLGGATTWSGAGILGYAHVTVENLAGARFDIRTDGDFIDGHFVNAGAVVKSVGNAGNANTEFRGRFDNAGSVLVEQGTISLRGTGEHRGAFATAAGAWLAFESNFSVTNTFAAGSRVAGNVRMAGNFGSMFIEEGALWQTDHTSMAGSGRLWLLDGPQLAQTTTLTMSGGGLRGAGSLVLTGSGTMSAGVVGGDGGNLVVLGTLDITGGSLGYNGGAGSSGIVNQGVVRWVGTTNLANQASGRFLNAEGARFEVMAGANFRGGHFINEGDFVKPVGHPGFRNEFDRFDNRGHVQIEQGAVFLLSGGIHSGSFGTADDAWIEFSGSTGPLALRQHDLLAGSSVSGNARLTGGNPNSQGVLIQPGALWATRQTWIDGFGRLTVEQTALTDTFIMNAGSLRGSRDLIVAGPATWTRGTIGGDGGWLVANGGLLIDSDGSSAPGVGHGAGSMTSGVVNHALAVWRGAGLTNHASGRFVNAEGAVFRIENDQPFSNGEFHNHGTLVKAVGAANGRTRFNADVVNSGSIELQQGTIEFSRSFVNTGSVSVAAGSWLQVVASSLVNSGVLRGTGVIRTAGQVLRNVGTIAPGFSPGTFTIDGGLALEASSVLEIELASASAFDRLTVLGNATLGGTLHIASLGYAPAVGDQFVIASFAQRLDDSVFSALSWTGFGNGVQFEVIYGANDITLGVLAVPEPTSWALWLAGVAGIAAVRRRRRQAADPLQRPS
jgi:MYXO-CTERM domain-containing protein